MNHSESQHQQALFEWAAYHKELKSMYHIPNGGFRNAREAARLKKEGVKSGVPDICLPVPRQGYHGLYIELKAEKNSSVSKHQKEWIAMLQQNGYMSVVCKGWVEAKEVIEDYMGLRR